MRSFKNWKCGLALAAVVAALPLVASAAEPPTATQPRPVIANKPVAGESRLDLCETAMKAGTFKTLCAALKSAELVETLKGQGPFTVLAPTDEAFAKLPSGTVETLLRPENKAKLTALLTYHVIPGNLSAADVAKLKSAKTVNGAEVAIKVNGEKVSIGNAQVIKTDIACANGVIHVIDTVLMPTE